MCCVLPTQRVGQRLIPDLQRVVHHTPQRPSSPFRQSRSTQCHTVHPKGNSDCRRTATHPGNPRSPTCRSYTSRPNSRSRIRGSLKTPRQPCTSGSFPPLLHQRTNLPRVLPIPEETSCLERRSRLAQSSYRLTCQADHQTCKSAQPPRGGVRLAQRSETCYFPPEVLNERTALKTRTLTPPCSSSSVNERYPFPMDL